PEIVVSGHDHDYERFAPQTPRGVADPLTGIREFIAGTGGAGLFTLGTPLPNSEVRNDVTFGVLKLTLSSGGYAWRFIPVAGKTVTAAGRGTCHDAPSATHPPATAAASFTFSATFSDAGVNDGPWAFTIAWGDSSAQTTGSATSQASAITATHTYAAAGTDTVRITVADKDGATGSATAAVNVSATNRPPTAVAGGPYAGSEGAAIAFDGSASSDPDADALSYAWS